MTILAAITAPGDGSLFLISDTLVSERGDQTGIVLGPHGAILPRKTAAGFRPGELRQKTLILRDALVAYAGASSIATGVLKRLRAAGDVEPARLREILDDYSDELLRSDTTVLLASCDHNSWKLDCYGPTMDKAILHDRTEVLYTGSGGPSFVDHFSSVRRAKSTTNMALGEHHLTVLTLLASVSEMGAREGVIGEFTEHAGGLVEIIRHRNNGFEKLPSANMISELLTVQGREAILWGGNYLDYCYYEDILVFRRFGDIRNAELLRAFATDALICTIWPADRKPSQEELEAAHKAMTLKSYNSSEAEVFSWTDCNDLSRRRVRATAPQPNHFRIRRVNDRFEIFRSHAFLAELAQRFGVDEVKLGGQFNS